MKILLGIVITVALLTIAANVAENHFDLALLLVVFVGITGALTLGAILKKL